MAQKVTDEEVKQAFAKAWNSETDEEFLYRMDVYNDMLKEQKEQERKWR